MTRPIGNTWHTLACRVEIDGARVADGSLATDNDAAPFVLAGLSVIWGRTTTVDQPTPAALTFTLKDWSGDRAFLDLARTGAAVTVDAVARIDGPSGSVVADPTMSRVPLGYMPESSVPSVRGVPPYSHQRWFEKRSDGLVLHPGWSYRLGEWWPGSANHRTVVDLPPADWIAPPAGFTAWNLIPRSTAGQLWTVTVTGRLGIGARGSLSVWTDTESHSHRAASDAVVIGRPTPLLDGDTAAVVEAPSSGLWMGPRVSATHALFSDPIVATAGTFADSPFGVTTFDEWTAYVIESYDVVGPAGASEQTARVFAGRITDAVATFNRGVEVAVTATDQLGVLANDLFEPPPFPRQPFGHRVFGILDAAGRPSGSSHVLIDPPYNSTSGEDVTVASLTMESTTVLEALQPLVAGHDLVLWTASHDSVDEPWLWIEDPQRRAAVVAMRMGAGGLVEVGPADLDPVVGTHLSACDLDLDPVQWTQSVSDIVTRVTIDHPYQPAHFPEPETRYVHRRSLLDGDDLVGVRAATLTSQAVLPAAVARVAVRLLDRLSGSGWRVSGLRWDLTSRAEVGSDVVARVLPLLDNRSRLGRAVMLTDLPDWSPRTGNQGGYVEGGTLVYDGNGWIVDLTLSAGQGLGAAATYGQTPPAWRYIDFPPSIRYADIRNAGVEI